MAKPLLAIDVDGVICPFGWADGVPPPEGGEWRLLGGLPYYVLTASGPHLQRLAERFELVWATGWEDRANDFLPNLLGLAELPVVEFSGEKVFGEAHWKLAALDRYAGKRPLAWIDDSFDDSCFEWAEAREHPTLLIDADSARGLEVAQVEAAIDWVDELSDARA